MDDAQPFTLVRNKKFIKFVKTLAPGKSVLSYQAMMNLSKDKFARLQQNIKRELSEAAHVCTTSDVWSKGRKSYLGMTAHILTDKLERRSFTIACRRLRGRHTFDTLAAKIESLLIEY